MHASNEVFNFLAVSTVSKLSNLLPTIRPTTPAEHELAEAFLGNQTFRKLYATIISSTILPKFGNVKRIEYYGRCLERVSWVNGN